MPPDTLGNFPVYGMVSQGGGLGDGSVWVSSRWELVPYPQLLQRAAARSRTAPCPREMFCVCAAAPQRCGAGYPEDSSRVIWRSRFSHA